MLNCMIYKLKICFRYFNTKNFESYTDIFNSIIFSQGDDIMSTSSVFAHIDKDLKENAEKILSKFGITLASTIQMLYSQIILTNSFPLDLKLPLEKPTSIGDMTNEEVDEILAKEFNI